MLTASTTTSTIFFSLFDSGNESDSRRFGIGERMMERGRKKNTHNIREESLDYDDEYDDDMKSEISCYLMTHIIIINRERAEKKL